MEIATTNYQISIETNFYSTETFNILRNSIRKSNLVLINDFGICYDYKNEPTIYHCGVTACPRSDYVCKTFSSFHGKIKFDETGKNIANTGYIGQIQPNGS